MNLMFTSHCLLTCRNNKSTGKNFESPSFYLVLSQTLLLSALRYYLARTYPLFMRLMLELEEPLSRLLVSRTSGLLVLYPLGLMIPLRGSVVVIVNLVLAAVPIVVVVAVVAVVA
jgi:hypothetical protein